MDTGSPEFRAWQHAFAALRDAENGRESHADVLRLSDDVIRTRNELTAAQVAAGERLPDEVVQGFARDDQLLHERDDAALSRNPPPSSTRRPTVPEQRGQAKDASP